MLILPINGNGMRKMTARPSRLLPQGSMLQIVVALGFSIAFAITAAWCPPQLAAKTFPRRHRR